MAVGESDTILFGVAAGVDADEAAAAELTAEDAALLDGPDDDGADDDGADDDGAEDAALLDGGDTAAVDTAGVVEVADRTVDPATGEVLAATDDDVAATPLSVPQPTRSTKPVMVAARVDRKRMVFLTVVEGCATLDGNRAAVNRRPFPGAG